MNHSWIYKPLIWSLRAASALALTALTWTNEISPGYIYAGWGAWALSFWLDHRPEWQQRLRSLEVFAVVGLISVFAVDFFIWGHTLFICVAHFLMLFQLFKLLGLKERKDCLQILMFSFFQMLSACTLAVDAWQSIILLLLIPIATAGLFWHQIAWEAEASGNPPPPAAAVPYRRWLAAICLAAIPVNILLATAMFVLFPRLAFRQAFAGLGSGRSGYNEQVNLEHAGVLNQDNSAVLWMQIIPEKDRSRWSGYLRGTTLDQFDGRRWNRSPAQVSQTLSSDTRGIIKFGRTEGQPKGLRQTITLVNSPGSTLFGSPFIGEAVAPMATLQYMTDGSVRWAIGWRKPLHYAVVSYDQPLTEVGTAPAASNANYLKLPSARTPRIESLIKGIVRGQRAPGAQARAIQDYLRSNYQYSLDQGSRADNPVEDFLFVRRRGPCGHFASAMAVMLRLQGIPSRIVAGYYKGTWNSHLGQYLFRERDAHAWVEAYIPGTGWMLFDPSPRVSEAPTAQLWLLRLRERWETVNYHWDRRVIEYDLYSQVKTLQDIQSNTHRVNAALGTWIDRHLMGFQRAASGAKIPREEGPGFSFKGSVIGLLLLAAVAGGFYYRRTSRASVDPAIAFYKKYLDRLARKGFAKIPSETGWEFAERLRGAPDYEKLREMTKRYYEIRFRSVSEKVY